MRLSERLQHTQQTRSGHTLAPAASEPQSKDLVNPVDTLKRRAVDALFARLGARLYDASLSEKQLRAYVVAELGDALADEPAPLSSDERQLLVASITDDVLGYGPLQRYLDDTTVTEIMVSAADNIYIERDGQLEETESHFVSADHLRRVIEKIVAHVGRRIDESSPMVDARLPDGSRVNAIIPPLAVDGPSLTIRKFARDPYQVSDLVEFGTITPQVGSLLNACVEGRLNILISGGTGTGKTTMLNVLSGFIPEGQRIVTIEDAVELQLHQRHVVRLESRPPNIEGRGQVAIRELVRNALRMRPDRIVVGEVRGGEALDMLQAMNTGHEGSLSTIHSNSPRDAISRLETMVLMAGVDLPIRAIREQISSAVDVVVHVTRLRDGSRRVTHVAEVTEHDGDAVKLVDVYLFDYAAGMDSEGRYLGVPKPTGYRPTFTDRLAMMGVQIPGTIFTPAVPTIEPWSPR